MTVPGMVANRNVASPASAQGIDRERANRSQDRERQDVAADKKMQMRAEADRTDRAEISTAARALAEVVVNDKPSLQLSAQDLRALTGKLPDE